MTCRHPSKSVSCTGEVYCLACGQTLGLASSARPCGCPADPRVFGHICRSEPAKLVTIVSRGVTLRYSK